MLRTVGVEEELLLVHPDSGEPRPWSAAVLDRAAQDDPGQAVFQTELFGQMLELATSPQRDMAELGAEIVGCRKEAGRLAGEIGCAVAALATYPLPVDPALTRHERYHWMAGRFGAAMVDWFVCGCHVHVSGVSDQVGGARRVRLPAGGRVVGARSAHTPRGRGR
ncbi:glutamate-cysteine ligase family protein, partial [Streptomyces sp. NPDC059627]